jgi:hypothetical protein
MTQASEKPRLNLTRIAAVMSLVSAGVLLVLVFVLPMVLKSATTGQILAAGAVTYVCAMLGLLVTFAVRDADPIIVLKAHMLGHTLRLFLTLGIGIALIKISGMDTYGVVITMSALYLPVMAVEAAMSAVEFQRCFGRASSAQATEVLS